MVTITKNSENYRISGDIQETTVDGWLTTYASGAIDINVNCNDGTTGSFHRDENGQDNFNAYYASTEPKVDFIQTVFDGILAQLQD